MKPIRMKLQLYLALVLGCLVTSPISAEEQDAHEIVRKSLVYIEATGATETLQQLKEVGTGFIVDGDGLILTSYHLIGNLEEKKADPLSVEIKVSIGSKNPPTIVAQIVDSKQSADLLLLKISPQENGIVLQPLHLGQMSDVPHITSPKILTSGFRGDSAMPSWVVTEAQVKSRSGPRGFTWVIDKEVDGGQSGSPVYIQNPGGEVSVIGVVKGVIEKGKDTVFVPITVAETLLLPIRMREMNERITKLTDQPKFDSQMMSYLSGQQDPASPLRSWFSKNIEAHLIEKFDHLIEINKKKIDLRLDNYMSNVVAYSYSSEFTFTGKKDDGHKTYYTLPFYKTTGDTGSIKCDIDYNNVKVKTDKPLTDISNPKALYKINDLQETQIPDPYPKPSVHLDKKLSSNNKSLYYGLDGPNEGEPSPYQQVSFWIARGEEFDGQINFLCTILIMGSAKVSQ
jgi:hypothetical protein